MKATPFTTGITILKLPLHASRPSYFGYVAWFVVLIRSADIPYARLGI